MRFHIEFDTSEDVAYDVALAVAHAYGLSSVEEFVEAEEDAPADNPAAPLPDGWTKPKMIRYVKALQPNAKKVLRVIAENAPSVDVDSVQQKSGLEGYTYAGSMSSFGFAVRNTRGVKEKPFQKRNRSYLIDRAIATLVVQVLDEA